MDFFKSVFSDDLEPSDSQTAPETSSDLHSQSQTSSPNPPQIPAISSAWTFGSSLLKTLATKSESVLETYRHDLQDFSSGLKKETATIREVASRAAKGFPSRLESGAAVAQESLETVGQAIDNIGSTVFEIIAQGKDSIFAADGSDSEFSDSSIKKRSDLEKKDLNLTAKPYSRVEAAIRAIQCDAKTYCEEPEDMDSYNDWKSGFMLDEKGAEIEKLRNENEVIGEIYDEVVPSRVDRETFWSRYFYRVHKVKKAEEARAKLVKRAIAAEEEEELSWDVDDDDDDNGVSVSEDHLQTEVEEIGKEVRALQIGEAGTSLERKNNVEDVFGKEEKVDIPGEDIELSGDNLESKVDDRAISEGKNDISDFSVVSSQPSSHEEDLGWDEIEDVGSGDDTKDAGGSPRRSDLRIRINAAEEDEELTWDIEDDDEPLKS